MLHQSCSVDLQGDLPNIQKVVLVLWLISVNSMHGFMAVWHSHKRALLNHRWHSIRGPNNKVDGPECCTACALWAVCCCGLERYKISVFLPCLQRSDHAVSAGLSAWQADATLHHNTLSRTWEEVCLCVCLCVHTARRLTCWHQPLHPVTSFSSRIGRSFRKNNEPNMLVCSLLLITVFRCCIVACSVLCVFLCFLFCFHVGFFFFFTYFRFIMPMRSHLSRHTNVSRASRTCTYVYFH